MRIGVFPCILSLFVLAAAGAARSDDGAGNPSLERILPQIRERHPGKFYDAEGPYRGADGQLRYRLKWMTPDGRIVWFDADARTGRVLGPDVETRGQRQQQQNRFREERRDDRRFERQGHFPRDDHPRRRR